jgi:dimethylamine/trimethylamine dehydrogenase
MPRNPRYDLLFEPVQIGPVRTKNRFYQVPHCNGMGHQMPAAHVAMREVKAEGGWAVVSTEECEIHPSGDLTPSIEARLWDDGDIPALALMCEAVHRHGALAAIELTHNGPTATNLYSREVALAPSHQPLKYGHPHQARAMTRRDIADYRRWHRNAALRAKRAGFDIVYVYAAHDLSLAMHFLQRRRNQRTDDYGGTLENRLRLLREVLCDTREAVGDRCAVALRFAVEEFLGPAGVSVDGEARRSCTSWPSCRTCGTSTSPPGTWIRAPRASPVKARSGRSPSGSSKSPASRWSASAASPRRTPWCAWSARACSI